MNARTLLLCGFLFSGTVFYGCASPVKAIDAENTAPVVKPLVIAINAFTGAVVSPFYDFHIIRDHIPDILKGALRNPYRHPEPMTCETLQEEVDKLSAVLGPDIEIKEVVITQPADSADKPTDLQKADSSDINVSSVSAPSTPSQPSLTQEEQDNIATRSVEAVKSQSVRGVETVATSVIPDLPFRSWVRKLSGAEKYAKEINATHSAGSIRRAYLKGWKAAMKCPPIKSLNPLESLPSHIANETISLPISLPINHPIGADRSHDKTQESEPIK